MEVQKFNYRDIEGNIISSKNIEYDENGKRTDKIYWKHYVKEKEIPIFYHLDELSKLKFDDTVFLVEGEKDVETIRSLGFNATTANNSSYKFKELKQLSYFKNLNVVIIPDLDSTGWNYAYTAGTALKKSYFPNSVKILDLSDLVKNINDSQDIPKGFDISDFLEQATANGYYSKKDIFLNEIVSNVEKINEFEPENAKDAKKAKDDNSSIDINDYFNVYTGTEIEEFDLPPIKWIVDDLIPDTGFIQFSGDPKAGKSTMMIDLAYSVAVGDRFLGKEVKEGIVIYIDFENSEDIFHERLKRLNVNNYDTSKLKWFSFNLKSEKPKPNLKNPNHNILEILDKAINIFEEKPVLIIIDTWGHVRVEEQSYLKETEEAHLLASFSLLHNIPIIALSHNTKMKADDPFNSSMGGNGLAGQFETQIVLEGKRDSLTGKISEHVLHIKSRRLDEKHLILDNSNYPKWKLVGDAEKITENRIKRELKENEYFMAIKLGLKRSKGKKFKATSGELRKLIAEIENVDIEEVPKSATVTAELKRLKGMLKEYANINYTVEKRKAHTMIHCFSYDKEAFLNWDSIISDDWEPENSKFFYKTTL